jgi:hypothetical protein
MATFFACADGTKKKHIRTPGTTAGDRLTATFEADVPKTITMGKHHDRN